MATSKVTALTARAIVAYYRKGGDKWINRSSGERTVKGRRYVVLESDGEVVEVYRVRVPSGALRILKKPPEKLMKARGRS